MITKVAQIIDLDIGETTVKDDTTSAGANIADIAYVDVKNNDSTDITVSYKMCIRDRSNVDLSQEFTNMITTQRGYQANSRIITVSDTLLEELINLKR